MGTFGWVCLIYFGSALIFYLLKGFGEIWKENLEARRRKGKKIKKWMEKINLENVAFGFIMTIGFSVFLYFAYWIWYYVCCGFLVTMEGISLGMRIAYFFLTLVGVGIIIGVIRLIGGWVPPR